MDKVKALIYKIRTVFSIFKKGKGGFPSLP